MHRVLGLFDTDHMRTLLRVSIAKALEERHQHAKYAQRTIGHASVTEPLDIAVVPNLLTKLEYHARVSETGVDPNDSWHDAG